LACKVVDLRSYEYEDDDYLSSSSPRDALTCASEEEVKQQQLFEQQKRRSQYDPQFREFDILKDMDHPNIIRLEKVFWSSETLFIFQELVTGGDLFSFLEHKDHQLSDIEAAVVLRQILKGVEYLHNQNIVHRDLKPDNILMTAWADGARVILTDFGNAMSLADPVLDKSASTTQKKRMFSVVGTLEYAAP
jgi:pheromone a factor receptor